jgi:uncharacterized membrane protein YjjP (DUF1212 family)
VPNRHFSARFPSVLSTTEPCEENEDGETPEFVVRLASALHAHGAATPDLEHDIENIMKQLGLEGSVLAQPTGLFVSIGPPGDQQASIIRVQPGEVNLEKLGCLDELAKQVALGEVSLADGNREVERIITAPRRYGGWLSCLCYGLASAAVCRFLGGGLREIAVAGCIGLMIGVASFLLSKTEQGSILLEPLAATIAASVAVIAANAVVPLSLHETILAGVISAVPGMLLTNAMIELATRNLVAGTARLAWVVLIFLEITFGVVLGLHAQRLFDEPAMNVAPIALPLWTEYLALIVAPLAFSVRFFARPRDIAWIVVACIASYAGSRLGAYMFDPRLGGFVGAFCASGTANLFARITGRPPAVLLAPAILILVPGSIGFGSVSSFLERNVVNGVEAAFDMVLVAMSIVIGYLIGKAVVPVRTVTRNL